MGVQNLEEVYKQKTLEAAANNIWDELKKIRKSGEIEKEKYMRRWIWELIQNASDCALDTQKVDISVDYDGKDILRFQHNGIGFTNKNLVDIITQISSKQSSEDDKTGKFGTGFISTNLLCEKITIESYLIEESKSFKFILDRSAKNYESMKDAIEKNLNDIDEVVNNRAELFGDKLTKFIYDLKFSENPENSRASIEEGLDVLKVNIPYLLAFNNNINTISVNGVTYFIDNTKEIGDKYEVIKVTNGSRYELLYKVNSEEFEIIIPFGKDIRGFTEIKQVEVKIPKLYCNFPLIGTELFPFPLVLNSKHFEVEKDRDKIREGDEKNKEILEKVLIEYKEFLQNISLDIDKKRVYNLCLEVFKENETPFESSYRNRVREIFESIPLVDCYDGNRYCIHSHSSDAKVCIPRGNNGKASEVVWELVKDFETLIVPTKDSLEFWNQIIEKSITLEKIHSEYLMDKTVDSLKAINKTTDVFLWLTQFYCTYQEIYSSTQLLDLVAPNQKREFKELGTLKIDKNIESSLKDITMLLGNDIYDILLLKELSLPNNLNLIEIDSYSVAKKIEGEIQVMLSSEVSEGYGNRTEEIQRAFSRLFLYFTENPIQGLKTFPSLYPQRLQLQTKEEATRVLKISEQINRGKLTEEQIDRILNDEEGILSLISSSDLPFNKTIEILYHKSNNSIYAKEKINKLIDRTVENVHKYLLRNPYYDISPTVGEWKRESHSSTVFIAKKEGRLINIIVRPYDEDKIIFYGEAEKIALHDEFELWIDNGNDDPRKLTLGDLLSITGITTFPLKKLFEEK